MASFFQRSRKALEEQGIDPARLPPGQYFTERFPVLHEGRVPDYDDLSQWDLRIFGLVGEERTLSWDDVVALAVTEVVVDIHCVTKWSKFDTPWKGVPFDAVCDLVSVDVAATHVTWHAEHGYTANVPLDEVRGLDSRGQPKCLLAYEFDGKPLAPDHGYPLRSFVPLLYFWKSAKWLRGVEFMAADRAGFWERNGYHMLGDPFREQRFSGD